LRRVDLSTPQPLVSQPSPLATKGQWRAWAKHQRASLLTSHLSAALIKQCLHWKTFQEADELLITWPTKDELDVRPLIQAFQGPVYLPRVIGPRHMAFHRFESEDALIQGPHGILEPAASSPPWQPSPKRITLLIAPALCVDTTGYRLGYGGGYFDAWLHTHRPLLQNSLTVASVVPSTLVVECLPHDDWDQPLDSILTENGATREQ